MNSSTEGDPNAAEERSDGRQEVQVHSSVRGGDSSDDAAPTCRHKVGVASFPRSVDLKSAGDIGAVALRNRSKREFPECRSRLEPQHAAIVIGGQDFHVPILAAGASVAYGGAKRVSLAVHAYMKLGVESRRADAERVVRRRAEASGGGVALDGERRGSLLGHVGRPNGELQARSETVHNGELKLVRSAAERSIAETFAHFAAQIEHGAIEERDGGVVESVFGPHNEPHAWGDRERHGQHHCLTG